MKSNIDLKSKPYEYITSRGDPKKIYNAVDNKFKIGDKVKIIDEGQFYSSYESMAIAMGIVDEENWMRHGLSKKHTGYVMDIKVHEDKFNNNLNDIIYGIEIGNKIALIGECGLEKMKNILPDRLFEI
jgi:ribosomal protein S17